MCRSKYPKNTLRQSLFIGKFRLIDKLMSYEWIDEKVWFKRHLVHPHISFIQKKYQKSRKNLHRNQKK